MKSSEAYRLAARALESGEAEPGCCAALSVVCISQYQQNEECVCADNGRWMKEIFAPKSEKGYWMGALTPANKNVRILALCFMAEFAADEERHSSRRR